MKLTAKVDNREELIELGTFRAALTDKPAMLRICAVLMQASIARTFREEGSPEGSWPRLAASTLLRKGYTTGHKLLILSGRLFGSITYDVSADVLTIGTSLVYARVQQEGSKDYMGGASGPRTREQMMGVAEHQGHYLRAIHYKMVEVTDRRGNKRMVPQAKTKGNGGKLYRGPRQQTEHSVSAHTRRQNIPARAFLVFRPEDPDRMREGVEKFLAGKAARLGKVGAA